MNIEHSGFDAPVTTHITEYVFKKTLLNLKSLAEINKDQASESSFNSFSFNSFTQTVDSADIKSDEITPYVSPLKFSDLTQNLKNEIYQAKLKFKKLNDDVDLKVFLADEFDKEDLKKFGVSPDGFIQCAIQLAYYKNQGKFDDTYEPAITRIFSEGRTETVRSCTQQKVDFVKCMMNKNSSSTEKIEKLKEACASHQKEIKRCLGGRGFDRHIFTLYLLSIYFEKPSPFLSKIIQRPWKLSTSQVPPDQTNMKTEDSRGEDLKFTSGGFGAVAKDGYGVSYVVLKKGGIFFHISSYFSCQKTSSEKFSNELLKSLKDTFEILKTTE